MFEPDKMLVSRSHSLSSISFLGAVSISLSPFKTQEFKYLIKIFNLKDSSFEFLNWFIEKTKDDSIYVNNKRRNYQVLKPY